MPSFSVSEMTSSTVFLIITFQKRINIPFLIFGHLKRGTCLTIALKMIPHGCSDKLPTGIALFMRIFLFKCFSWGTVNIPLVL